MRRTTVVLAIAALLAALVVAAAPPATAAPRVDDVLTPGEQLLPGDRLVSPSGRYSWGIDAAGRLRVTEPGSWLTGDEPFVWAELATGVAFLAQQADGNLVAYGADLSVRRSFGYVDSPYTETIVQDDRNVVRRYPGRDHPYGLGTEVKGVMRPGEVLLPGDRAPRSDGASVLLMTDGNLVLYAGSTPLWSTGTAGNPGAGAVFQTDGNLVVYSSAAAGRRALWSSGTAGVGGLTLVVEDREISLDRPVPGRPGEAVWASGWASDRLVPGDALDPGDRRGSVDGRCVLVMQVDENLVEYCDSRVAYVFPRFPRFHPEYPWASKATDLVMQPDGNLVTYRRLRGPDSAPEPMWFSQTGVPGSSMVVQGDGNVVVVGPDGRPVWSRFTGRLR